MSCSEELKQWVAEVSRHLPQLSRTQAWVLAMYSFAMTIIGSCGQTKVALTLSHILNQSPSTIRQRLREWTYDADDKTGDKRQAVEVSACFAGLMGWVMSRWSNQEVVLALDATYLKGRFTILALSVVYQGGAIPVAWRIMSGDEAGEWHPIWVKLLQAVRASIPSNYRVFVLTDRGLASQRLFQAIVDLNYVPMMRIRAQGMWRAGRSQAWRDLSDFAQRGMSIWCGQATVFKNNSLPCTLFVSWEKSYEEPMLIITSLRPIQVSDRLYPLRSWIEACFKDLKRGGLRWEQTKMTDPQRAERLWLVMAVALLGWATVVPSTKLAAWAEDDLANKVSWATRGFLLTLFYLLNRKPIQRGNLNPYPTQVFLRSLKTYP